MEIKEKDLGKVVQLPVRPEWGPGIITKIENRFAHIRFKDAEEKTAKKYLRAGNPLILAKDQSLARGGSSKRRIKSIPAKPGQPEGPSADE